MKRGQKRAGSDFQAPERTEQGPLTCGTCQGNGYVTRPQAEADEEGMFDGDANVKCPTCKGAGKR